MPDAQHPFAPVADPGHPVDVDLPSRTHQPSDFYLLWRLQMIGPDHYRESERLAEQAERLFEKFVAAHDEDGDTPDVHLIRRQAEHCREMGVLRATLALAAATALTGAMAAESYVDEPELKAWHDAAGVKAEAADEPGQPEPAAEPVPPLSDAEAARADLAAESLTTLRSKLRGEAATS